MEQDVFDIRKFDEYKEDNTYPQIRPRGTC